MKGLKLLTLQLFAEEDKTFTQEELDRIVAERVAREKRNYDKQIEDLKFEHKKEMASFNDDTKEKELLSLENEKSRLENEKLMKEIQELRKQNRRADIISTYQKDELPCSEEFSSLVSLVADIEDDGKRAEIYNSIKKYATAIQTKVKQEALKAQETPNGSTSTSGGGEDNPFKSGNLTEITKLVMSDKAKAKELATLCGKYETYKYLF